MAVQFENLVNYVQENRLPLIKDFVLKGKSIGLMNLQTDIKTSAKLNLLSTDVVFGDGNGCGWNAEGDVTFSQRELKTGLVKVNMSFCDKEFRKYWMQYEVKTAAGQKTLPFEEDFIAGIQDKVAEAKEKAVWQGDTDSDVNNLKYFDGLLKLIGAEEEVIKPEIAEGTSVYDAIRKVYMAIPEEILEKAVIYVGADTFRSFIQEMVDKNLYHYSADNSNQEFVLPATNVKVVALNGLNGTNKIVATYAENLFYGCDLVNDSEVLEFWYSKDCQEFRLAIEFNAGTQVAHPDKVVMATLS